MCLRLKCPVTPPLLQFAWFMSHLNYFSQDGQFHKPVMVHRAVLGSLERMIAILAENFGGKWWDGSNIDTILFCLLSCVLAHHLLCIWARPLWLSPVQVMVISVGGDNESYGKQVSGVLCCVSRTRVLYFCFFVLMWQTCHRFSLRGCIVVLRWSNSSATPDSWWTWTEIRVPL